MVMQSYALEQLYIDQAPDLVADTIPAVLAWLPADRDGSSAEPIGFAVHRDRGHPREVRLSLRWDMSKLTAHDPGVAARAKRMRTRRTAEREHVTELAAYGLALVGISVWMPGRRAIGFRDYAPPDILFDATEGAVRGVEVAGRSSGGLGALRVVLEGSKARPGKRAELLGRDDLAEVHASLWCARPSVAILVQVKP